MHFQNNLTIFWGIHIIRKKGIDRTILKKWPKKDLNPKDNTFEMFIFIYSKDKDMLVLNVKGNKKVEEEIISQGPWKEFEDEE